MGVQRIQVALKAGPRRPASETPLNIAFRRRADDGPILNAGMVAL